MNEHIHDGVLIWGAGAIGGVIGAHIARSGLHVTLVDVSVPHVTAIRERGLTIVGDLAAFNIKIPIFTPENVSGRWRFIMLAVKAQFTDSACRAFAPHLDSAGSVLSLQNGLNAEIIAQHVGRDRTYVALGSVVGDVLDPGEIRFGGVHELPIGQIDGKDSPMLAEIVALIQRFEPSAYGSREIQCYLWGKHCFNTITCATAMANSPFAELMLREAFRPLWCDLIREVLGVAFAQGIVPRKVEKFDPMMFAPDASVGAEAFEHLSGGGQHKVTKPHSGMWRDLAIHKRRTEVDALLSPIADVADRHGLPSRMLRAVVRIIREIEQGRRAQSDDNLLELMGLRL